MSTLAPCEKVVFSFEMTCCEKKILVIEKKKFNSKLKDEQFSNSGRSAQLLKKNAFLFLEVFRTNKI